jgi:enoyl-CoA hydratase
LGKYSSLLLEKRSDGVAILTLNRPDVHNALNVEIRFELSDAFDALATDDSIGAVVLTGAGSKSFSVGADLKNPDTNHSASDFTAYLKGKRKKGEWYDRLVAFPKGVISAVNGYCAGSGLSMAIAADMVVASENATFWMPQVSLGILPHNGTLIRLARCMTSQRLMEFALTGRRYTAAEAQRHGMVMEVTPTGTLLQRATELAQAIAKQPKLSVELTKEAFAQCLELTWDQAMRIDPWKEFGIFQTVDRKNRHEEFAARPKKP